MLRGQQSSLYGSEAIGGVIQYLTATGRDAPGYSARLEGGSFGTVNGAVRAAGVTGKLDYAVTGTYQRSDGYPIAFGGTRDVGEHGGAASVKLTYALAPNVKVTAVGRYTRTDAEFDNTDSNGKSTTFGRVIDSPGVHSVNEAVYGRQSRAARAAGRREWRDPLTIRRQSMTRNERVLVTGGSGFIAGHCIARLLADGWQVRTTVRDLAKAPQLRTKLGELASSGDAVEIVAADLETDAGWAEAVSDCAFVLHVASPFPARDPENDDVLIRPARDGALRVLKAAKAAGVRRVVMTSSVAAVAYGRGGRSTPFTEEDWSDAKNLKDSSPYERSKAIAERAAWDWMRSDGVPC